MGTSRGGANLLPRDYTFPDSVVKVVLVAVTAATTSGCWFLGKIHHQCLVSPHLGAPSLTRVKIIDSEIDVSIVLLIEEANNSTECLYTLQKRDGCE